MNADRLPLFCDTALAERIERAEAQLVSKGGAPTVAARRRRGIQTALLSAWLADAADAGCDIAVITTQPGSKAQQDAQRRGFDLLDIHAILVKPQPTRSARPLHKSTLTQVSRESRGPSLPQRRRVRQGGCSFDDRQPCGRTRQHHG